MMLTQGLMGSPDLIYGFSIRSMEALFSCYPFKWFWHPHSFSPLTWLRFSLSSRKNSKKYNFTWKSKWKHRSAGCNSHFTLIHAIFSEGNLTWCIFLQNILSLKCPSLWQVYFNRILTMGVMWLNWMCMPVPIIDYLNVCSNHSFLLYK